MIRQLVSKTETKNGERKIVYGALWSSRGSDVPFRSEVMATLLG